MTDTPPTPDDDIDPVPLSEPGPGAAATGADQGPDDAPDPSDEDRKALLIRAVFMILFAILLNIAGWLLGAVTVLQFLWMFFARERNARLSSFGAAIGAWMAQVAQFQSAASEEKPFPWKPWPSA